MLANLQFSIEQYQLNMTWISAWRAYHSRLERKGCTAKATGDVTNVRCYNEHDGGVGFMFTVGGILLAMMIAVN
jgi:hypothetical protein